MHEQQLNTCEGEDRNLAILDEYAGEDGILDKLVRSSLFQVLSNERALPKFTQKQVQGLYVKKISSGSKNEIYENSRWPGNGSTTMGLARFINVAYGPLKEIRRTV